MSKRMFMTAGIIVLLLVAVPLMAQNPTGIVTGRVMHEGAALPGTTVTAKSPSMQGTRTAITGISGDYTFKFLPPGEYELTFSLDGFKSLEYDVKVSAAQTRTVDAVMYPEAVTEEIVVTSSYETVSSTSQSAVTFEKDLIESLPMDRDFDATVQLSPGVTTNEGSSMRDATVIAGAVSNENLFMVNGIVVNENIRGQEFDLFIEDAIEETTTSISGISAEYGRFSGGVVNMITKSGGNEFSGSYRLNLENDDWISKTPVTTADRQDELNKIHEATFGGYVLKDRLWFFLAYRDREVSQGLQTVTGVPFNFGEIQERTEAKLTLSPHSSHRVLLSYMDVAWDQLNREFFGAIELSALDASRSQPQEMSAVNYTGVITDNFFLEAQMSKREFTFEQAGPEGDIGVLNRTPILDFGWFGDANNYAFCGDCPGSDEERDNENWLVKGSWLLSSEKLGSHDVVFGYDSFDDIILSNNFQSVTDYILMPLIPGHIVDDTYYPIFEPNAAWVYWGPVELQSQGTSFTTNSLFVNDTWRVSDKLTLSLGARYDENDGQTADGSTVADDSKISPRVGLTYDLKGDGDLLFHASYGRYVAAIANGVADVTPAGAPSTFYFWYTGPPINTDPTYTSQEAVGIVMDWWFDTGGPNAHIGDLAFAPYIPGLTSIVPDSIKSPHVDEISIGVTKRLGTRGLVRADYVNREFGDFYMNTTNTSTGQVTDAYGTTYDLAYVGNDDGALSRKYDGVHAQFQYRIGERWQFGGNWTWSKTRGNWEGENSGSGPIAGSQLQYPEYREARWNYPYGDLWTDQRNRVRTWVAWEAISSSRHNLTLSLSQIYQTGYPYGAQGTIDPSAYVDNPGYANPLSSANYFYTNRDAYRTDDITATGLAANYSFFIGLFGTDVEIFVQPEVRNLFNEDGAVAVNDAVVDLEPFNPFTETPVEGVNYRLGANFGQPVRENDFQDAREYRISLGIRF